MARQRIPSRQTAKPVTMTSEIKMIDAEIKMIDGRQENNTDQQA